MTEPIDPRYPENDQASAQHAASLAALTEDQALAQLKQRNLLIEAVEEIVRNAGLMKSRKVRIVLAAHPCAPRRVALRLIREFYTFDLMQFALRPGTPADLRRFADELLVSRVASITLGECISLARRSSEMVTGALLLHHEWGFSFQEIAGMLGISAAAARARASRGMAGLRGALIHLQRVRA